MAYPDVIKAIQDLQHAGVYSGAYQDKASSVKNLNTTGVNPYSSAAYGPSAGSIYGNIPAVNDPRTLYRRYGKGDFLTRATQGLTGYKMGAGLDPFAKQISGIFGGGTVPKNWAGLGPAAGLYGATRDMDPYTYSPAEKWGTIGSTAMAAHSLAPMLNPLISQAIPMAAPAVAATATSAMIPAVAGMAPIAGMHPMLLIGSLLLGNMFAKKQERTSDTLNKEVIEDINKQRAEGAESRSEALAEARTERDASYAEQLHFQEASRYGNQYGGHYNRPRADEGMKFSPKELNKIASAGRNGDTQLAHINPQEAQMLKAMGGSGTINPYTGLREYGWLRNLVNAFGGAATGAVSSAGNIVHDVTSPIAKPVFKSFNKFASPISRNLNRFLSTALGKPGGGGFFGTAGKLKGGLRSAMQNTLQGLSTTLQTAADPLFDVGKPIAKGIHNTLDPIMRGIRDVAVEPVMKGITNISRGIIEATGAGLKGVPEIIGTGLDKFVRPLLFPPTSSAPAPGLVGKPQGVNRQELKREEPVITKTPSKGPFLSGLKQLDPGGKELTLAGGDWLSDKDNPYVRENVEYYEHGGKANVIAEFTGNELIVNDQSAVENGLATGNYAQAAAPIRQAMKRGYVTPGIETHQGNPLPVDEQGNIYAGGGALPFQVKKGAGIYDSATDQFNKNMTDKEIAMIAKKNIAKWKSNNMA